MSLLTACGVCKEQLEIQWINYTALQNVRPSWLKCRHTHTLHISLFHSHTANHYHSVCSGITSQ